MKFAGIYYSHEAPPANIGTISAMTSALTCALAGIPLIEVGPRVTLGAKRGHDDISARIAFGCQDAIAIGATHVLLFEHDVLYPQNYVLEAIQTVYADDATSCYFYNTHVLRLNEQGYGTTENCKVTSNLLAPVNALLETMEARRSYIAKGGVIKWGEPGRRWKGCPDVSLPMATWDNSLPSIDVRLGGNYTGSRQLRVAMHGWFGWPDAAAMRQVLMSERA
jgi:hypothetical protein